MPEVTTITRHRVRVACDNANPSLLLNKANGNRIRIYRARAFQLEIALFYGQVFQQITPFASVTAEIKTVTNGAVDVDSAPLATSTVNAADFDTECGREQWDADTNQQVIIPFENAQTGFDMTGATRNLKEFALIITGITTDVTAKRLTLVEGRIEVLNDGGVTSANTPAAGDPTYLTADEIVALLGSYVKVQTDGSVTFLNSSGYGVKVYATEGNAPELAEVVINPALP